MRVPSVLLRWEVPEKPIPAHPYRDTALTYAALGLTVIVIAWATGGHVGTAVALSFAAFLLAWGWGSLRWWKRKDQAARKAGAVE